MVVKGCIFDLDGVLVDTSHLHYLAWKRLARELGFEFSEEHNERLKGVSRMRSLEILLEVGGLRVSESEKARLAKQKNDWYVESILKLTPTDVLPGALTFLKEVRAAGLKVALGSASKNAETILVNTGIKSYFDAIIDGTHTSEAKPNPEVFLLGAKALSLSPAECVVFEDAEAGIEAALHAGMRAVGIGSPERLAKADVVVASFLEFNFAAFQTHYQTREHMTRSYFKVDAWKIIEEGFDKERVEIAESVFSLGNGYMGGRANFEETYSGKTLQGNYLAGIYYPDKTRVGWWKNGYPEYFAKVLNATNWNAIDCEIDGERVDLALATVTEFSRELNMKEGFLKRFATLTLPSGKSLRIESQRFLSLARKNICAIKYAVTPLNFDAPLKFSVALDGDIKNKDANYDEKFWTEVARRNNEGEAWLTVRTRKTEFDLCSYMSFDVESAGIKEQVKVQYTEREKYIAQSFVVPGARNKTTTLYKYVSNVTSRETSKDALVQTAKTLLAKAQKDGFETLLKEQAQAWATKWLTSDIVIEGDIKAQQGIRFNIFQLNQTYTGEDESLNIGPKGFTGEKYGGSTYWDTEAYCLPFYLSTADEHVARNLLKYRFKHLEKAKENARNLGFTKGALYPMVTMNGEECHNEWEITFEEIHRNGAIAHAIYNYVNYTGDKAYLGEYGCEVLVELSRFWEERAQWNARKQCYMILGVTGPNEYENNVNNNWYTNRIAAWTLDYTLEVLEHLKKNETKRFDELVIKLGLAKSETETWRTMSEKMYYPADKELGVYLQQDGFLDKDLRPVSELRPSDRPLCQKWSWDRILRSCYIKQADVLQGLFFLGHLYDKETKKKNFDFYEPLTVHESSLSPCVHSILACELGYKEKAYEMYLRTARLDLDNYNNDTEDGCHTTSMAGTWMSVVHGFGGLRVEDGRMHLNPTLPQQWKSFSFQVLFRGVTVKIEVGHDIVKVANAASQPLELVVAGKGVKVDGHSSVILAST